MDQPRRRLSAVWFADIVGYTPLSARDEPLALRLIAELQTLAPTIVEQEFEGRLVKFIGDAVLAEFSSTESAVRAAVALQERYQARAAALGFPSQLRAGVHLGEVVATSDGDLYGDGINTAARLQGEAAPGQVIVSEDVWRQLRQRPEFQFEPLGGVDLKGLTTRIDVYNVLFGATAVLTRTTASVAMAKRRRSTGVVAIAGSAVIVAAAAAFWMNRTPRPDGDLAVAIPSQAAEQSRTAAPEPPAASDPVPAAEGAQPAAPPTAARSASAPGAARSTPAPAPAQRQSAVRTELPAAPPVSAAAPPPPATAREQPEPAQPPAASPAEREPDAAPVIPSPPREAAVPFGSARGNRPPVATNAPAEADAGGETDPALRAFLEEFAAALATADPQPTLRRLFPDIMPMQLQAFGGIRRQFGADVTTGLGRVELLSEQGPARQIRFFVIASSSTRPQVPLAFEATIAAPDGQLRFMRLLRAFGGSGMRQQ